MIMTAKSQRRYTDQELLTLLQILASDHSKRPTHRAILKDTRLPTHHTYIRRFGSLEEAFEKAGILMMDLDNMTHDAIKALLSSEDGHEEWVSLGDIVVDFKVTQGDREIYIDIVNLGGVDPELVEGIKNLRRVMATGHLQETATYIQITDLHDYIALTGGTTGIILE
jgi:hypothetical protein